MSRPTHLEVKAQKCRNDREYLRQPHGALFACY